MKGWLEPGELLILSYGLGIYNIKCVGDLDIDDTRLKYLEIDEILKVAEERYVAISKTGKMPSHMEIAIQETSDFRQDERFVVNNGSKKMRDRFFLLHTVSTV